MTDWLRHALELIVSDYRYAALAVAVPIAAVCAVLSVFVVLRRMAFIGQGVSHAGFGGIALAILLAHWWPVFETPLVRYATVALFCVAAALAMGLYSRAGKVSEDAAIGILLVATMALGAVLFNVRIYVLADTRWQPSWESLLFGSIFSADAADLAAAYGLALVVLGTVGLLYKELVSFTYDPVMARIEGLPVKALHALLLVLLSLTVVLALRAVGFLMVSALLILPAATANLLSRRFGAVMALSLVVCLAGTIGGLLLNLFLVPSLPPGAVIVLTLFAIFSLTFFATGVIRKVR
jgi:zinc transport system permease protein